MGSSNIATIQFTDAGSGDTGVAIVRLTDKAIGLCLSPLEHNGDAEVYLSKADANRLVAALNTAIQQCADMMNKDRSKVIQGGSSI